MKFSQFLSQQQLRSNITNVYLKMRCTTFQQSDLFSTPALTRYHMETTKSSILIFLASIPHSFLFLDMYTYTHA